MPDTSKPAREDVEAVERAAQRSVCNVPDGDLPEDLQQALDRRVQANLEQATSTTPARLGGTDPEVRRLEAPHRKRVTSSVPEQPTKPRGKPAKKSASRPAATNPKKGSD